MWLEPPQISQWWGKVVSLLLSHFARRPLRFHPLLTTHLKTRGPFCSKVGQSRQCLRSDAQFLNVVVISDIYGFGPVEVGPHLIAFSLASRCRSYFAPIIASAHRANVTAVAYAPRRWLWWRRRVPPPRPTCYSFDRITIIHQMVEFVPTTLYITQVSTLCLSTLACI